MTAARQSPAQRFGADDLGKMSPTSAAFCAVIAIGIGAAAFINDDVGSMFLTMFSQAMAAMPGQFGR